MNEGTPSIMDVVPVGNAGITEDEQIEMVNIFARRLRGSMDRMSLFTLRRFLQVTQNFTDEELASLTCADDPLRWLVIQGCFWPSNVRFPKGERFWFVAGVCREDGLWFLGKFSLKGMEGHEGFHLEVMKDVGPKEVRDTLKAQNGEWGTDYFHMCASLVGYADNHAKDRLEKYQAALLLQQGMEAELRLMRRMVCRPDSAPVPITSETKA